MKVDCRCAKEEANNNNINKNKTLVIIQLFFLSI